MWAVLLKQKLPLNKDIMMNPYPREKNG